MSEDEILQISNDISEDMLAARVTKTQLVEVVKFWQRQADKNWNLFSILRSEMVSLVFKSVKEPK